MIQFSIGDKVHVVSASSGAYGANGRDGVVTDKPSTSGCGSGIHVEIDGTVWALGVSAELTLLPLNNYKVGQVYTDGDTEFKVLAVVGGLVALSKNDSLDEFDEWRSFKDMDELLEENDGDFHLKTEADEIKEVTIEEIAELVGVRPEQVRVKKAEA